MEEKSTVERLLEQSQANEHQEALVKENVEQLKTAVNRIFSSPDGEFFFKFLRKGLRVDVVDRDFNPMALAGDKALRNIYLSIWKLLDADVRQKLEGGQ